MEQLTCSACGSASVTVASGFLTCKSCDSVFQLQAPAPAALAAAPVGPAPEGFFPFALDGSQVPQSFRRWLASLTDAPDDLLLKTQLGQVTPLWMPAYTYEIEYTANWRVEIETGDDDWEGRRGTQRGVARLGRMGSTDIRTAALTEAQRDAEALIYEDGWTPLSGFTEAHRFAMLPVNVTREQADAGVGAELRQHIENLIEEELDFPMMRNVQIDTTLIRQSVALIHFPFYLVDYTYNGSHYQVALDGRTDGLGHYARRPECDKIASLKSWFLGISWIPVVIGGLAFAVMVFFDDDSNWVWHDFFLQLVVASLLLLPVTLLLGWLGKRTFVQATDTFQARAKEVVSRPGGANQVLSLERGRKRNIRLWKTCLSLLTLAAIAIPFVFAWGYLP
ncbi:MAG: hypothetical protein FWD83_09795 [Promicromonosporaceae bacterium]|nr:hypothetical protein [Promicromonosporaceae bacterium]